MIVKKICNLGAKFLGGQKGEVIYKNLWHRSIERRELSIGLSKFIAKRNNLDAKRNFTKYLTKLNTYDGSFQSVHPDIINFKNNTYLTVTPYPYGIDIYENPSIYIKKDNNWEAIKNNPICKPILKANYHLSDPCFYKDNEKIYLYYRQTFKDEINPINFLYVKESLDGLEWAEEKLVCESNKDTLISPSVVRWENEDILFHVKIDQLKSSEENSILMKSYLKDKMIISDSKAVSVSNMPNNMYIWHMGIKENNKENSLLGIFLLKEKNSMNHKLYLGKTIDKALNWEIKEEILFPNEIRDKIKYPYKATMYYDENEKLKIITSIIDKEDKCYILEIDGE